MGRTWHAPRVEEQRDWRWTTDCPTGKFVFPTKAIARAHASRLRRQGRITGLRPYRCPECGGVHLGHKPLAVMRGQVVAADYYATPSEGIPTPLEARVASLRTRGRATPANRRRSRRT